MPSQALKRPAKGGRTSLATCMERCRKWQGIQAGSMKSGSRCLFLHRIQGSSAAASPEAQRAASSQALKTARRLLCSVSACAADQRSPSRHHVNHTGLTDPVAHDPQEKLHPEAQQHRRNAERGRLRCMPLRMALACIHADCFLLPHHMPSGDADAATADSSLATPMEQMLPCAAGCW
jgi:hypothetical protein